MKIWPQKWRDDRDKRVQERKDQSSRLKASQEAVSRAADELKAAILGEALERE